MEHFANFGYVKAANKVKKNDFLLKKGEDLYASLEGSSVRRLLDDGYTLDSLLYSHRRFPTDAKAWSRANVEFPQKPVKELPQYLAGKNRPMFLGESRKAQRKAQGLPELMRKPTTGEYAESRLTPNTDAFTDVRRTDDPAASPTGYLGFRKDPYKGYGGMMEEPVDLLKGGNKARIPY
jgi:hypothetical protein